MKHDLLTVGSVAKELGVSRYRIHQLLKETPSRFPSAFQLPSGQWLIPVSDLAANRIRKPGPPYKRHKR